MPEDIFPGALSISYSVLILIFISVSGTRGETDLFWR